MLPRSAQQAFQKLKTRKNGRKDNKRKTPRIIIDWQIRMKNKRTKKIACKNRI